MLSCFPCLVEHFVPFLVQDLLFSSLRENTYSVLRFALFIFKDRRRSELWALVIQMHTSLIWKGNTVIGHPAPAGKTRKYSIVLVGIKREEL